MAVMNQSARERTLRMVVGVVLAFAAWAIWFGGAGMVPASAAVSLVVLLIGLASLVTGLIGWCPLYTMLGISTEDDVGA
jgi:hypothetical protein